MSKVQNILKELHGRDAGCTITVRSTQSGQYARGKQVASEMCGSLLLSAVALQPRSRVDRLAVLVGTARIIMTRWTRLFVARDATGNLASRLSI